MKSLVKRHLLEIRGPGIHRQSREGFDHFYRSNLLIC